MRMRFYLYILNLLFFAFVTNAAAEESMPSTLQMQAGVDYWYLDQPPLSTDTTTRSITNLFMANSSPKWDYRSTSPWIKASGDLQLSSGTTFRYKVRAEQSDGMKLDDFHIDWSISPRSGIRGGVVDYKTSLCRTYDLDSPWVRENDPFCVSRISNIAILSSPGVQAYAQSAYDNYHVEALVGIYRPRAFGYAPDEFSNVALQPNQTVEVNNRWGWSLNLLDTLKASEVRLSWLGGTQETNRAADGYRAQKNSLWYLSASFYPLQHLQVRGYFIRSSTKQDSYDDPYGDIKILEADMVRESKALEVIYQINGANTVGLGTSIYTHNWKLAGLNGYEALSSDDFLKFTQRSQSVTWRHNFENRVHSSIQFTQSSNNELLWTQRTQAKAWGIGLQIGYAYY